MSIKLYKYVSLSTSIITQTSTEGVNDHGILCTTSRAILPTMAFDCYFLTPIIFVVLTAVYSYLPLAQALSLRASIGTSTNPAYTSNNDDGLPNGFVRSPSKAPLFLYNSLTRSKEIFTPIRPPQVSLYTCGPTVYDAAHVGNFRAFLTYDILKRVLLYLGFDVKHVCNLTDIDDKIIQRATERGISIQQLTNECANLFFDDLNRLNTIPATAYPRATQYVDAMMDLILALDKKGLAYETSDGSWYFRTQQQPGYGQQLVNLNWDDLRSQDGGDGDDDHVVASSEKEHFADFCVWKAYKPGVDREDAVWSSDRLKRGRPGWHLECSAMCRAFFGNDATIDLHGGGVDLKFPHHENEIAQSQGAMSNPTQRFCNCWFHNGFVNINDEKMSKSLGNFVTLQSACPTVLDQRAYRYLVVSSQYRNPLSFTDQAMQASKNAIRRLDKVRTELSRLLAEGEANGVGHDDTMECSHLASTAVPAALNNFEAAIRDDLSMPRAAASLFALVKEAEQAFKSDPIDWVGLRALDNALRQMDQVFGIFYTPTGSTGTDADGAAADSVVEIPSEVLDLVSQRGTAKAAQDWALADSLRERIAALGYTVQDVKGGEPIVTQLQER